MPKDNDYDRSMKILLIGNSGVGKSNLLMRFAVHNLSYSGKQVYSQHVEYHRSRFRNFQIMAQKVKYVEKDRQKIKVVLWDTAGQERFRTITNGYYRGADGIIIVYDITDRESFQNVNMWYDQMSKSVNQKVACMLIGNKLDMDSRRAVETSQGQNLAYKYGIPFIETSAKTSENVTEMFNTLIDKIIIESEGRTSSRPKLKPPLPLTQSRKNQNEYCSCCGN